jgi:biopolymer transport protein TolQ
MNFFSGNALWHLTMQSDAISKIVLLLLLGMSVACWTIFFTKLLIFRIKIQQYRNAQKKIISLKTVPDLIAVTKTWTKTSPGYLTNALLSFAQGITHNFVQPLNQKQWYLVEKQCDNSLEAILLHNESYLFMLSSSAAVAPLLGLFGTVWGLIHSFIQISETQVADIATIAPGIAEALITTLAGLIVAIPALLMFNYLQTKIRQLEHSILLFADTILFIMQPQQE